MAQSQISNETAQVTTGNVRTTVDFPNTALGSPFPYPSGVFPNPLGTAFFDNAISASNLNGQPTKYRYVKYQSTANPAVQAAPAAVWWADPTMTTVTGVLAEAWGGQNSFAGLMMPNTTDLPSLTAALLNANGGAAVWIAVAGWVTGVVTAATTIGDELMASQANWTTTGGFSRMATPTTAPTGKVSAYSATAGSPSTVYVAAESL